MKERLSVTVDTELIAKLDEILLEDNFRNKSHLVEVALKQYLRKTEE